MLTLGLISCNSISYSKLYPQYIGKPNARYQLELLL